MQQNILIYKILEDHSNTLFLGNIDASTYKDGLNIQMIICINFNANKLNHNIQYIEEHIDTKISNQKLDQQALKIEEGLQKGSVLICCETGLNLAPIIIMAYLIKIKKWKYEKSYYYVKERRNAINPSLEYRNILIEYSQSIQLEQLKLFNIEIKQLKENQNIYFDESPKIMTPFHSDLGTQTPQFRDSPICRGLSRRCSIKNDLLNWSFQLDEIESQGNQMDSIAEEELESPQFIEHIRKRHRRHYNHKSAQILKR